jgi:hypothetical protein
MPTAKTRRSTPPRRASFSPDRQQLISSWVSDQFEMTRPRTLAAPPDALAACQRWESDPDSGITGTVYVSDDKVYYSATMGSGKMGWWDVGPLPAALRR